MNQFSMEEDFLVLSNKLQDENYYNEIATKIGMVEIHPSAKLMLTKFFYILKNKNFCELKELLNGEDDELQQIQLIAIKIMVIKINMNDSDNTAKLTVLKNFIDGLISKIKDRYKNNINNIDKNKLFKLYNLSNQIKNLEINTL